MPLLRHGYAELASAQVAIPPERVFHLLMAGRSDGQRAKRNGSSDKIQGDPQAMPKKLRKCNYFLRKCCPRMASSACLKQSVV